MGDKYYFQPLTGKDRIEVVLYRLGIVFSAIVISIASYMMFTLMQADLPTPSLLKEAAGLREVKVNLLLIALYISVGSGVFFIHLYVNRFKRALIKLYIVSLACLIILFVVGRGNASGALINEPYGPLLLIPLSACLGFITAKEAFCFKLREGYLLALIMPCYLLLMSMGGFTLKGATYGLIFIAALIVLFTFRKVFMPVHYDVGDKAAYTQN